MPCTKVWSVQHCHACYEMSVLKKVIPKASPKEDLPGTGNSTVPADIFVEERNDLGLVSQCDLQKTCNISKGNIYKLDF